MIVLHYTAMDSAKAARDRLCDPETEVSAHYLVDEVGTIWQLVPDDKRAWHAGAGQWGRVTDVNSQSIGIELANTGFAPFPAPQMAALEELLRHLMDTHHIPPERLIGHSDMAPSRKGDPGARFDWRRLAVQGLSVWPSAAHTTGDAPSFLEAATLFGYAPDLDEQTLLIALRLRFRPWARGPLDQTDLAIIRDLAHRFPVDRTPPTS